MFTNLRNRLLSQWAFYLTVAFLFSAALLRTLIIYQGRNELTRGILLLSAWLLLFLSQPAITRKWQRYFLVYLIFQTALVIGLYLLPVYPDYFAILFAILGMQIIQVYPPKASVLLIAIFTPITIVMIIPSLGIAQAIALGVLYTGVNAIMASFAFTAQRAQTVKEQNRVLLEELAETNHQLQAYTEQLERLAVAHERNNLARELHDSVTQTLFSMTLATKSALLLIERDPSRVDSQMLRLNELAKSALAEMRLLMSELNLEKHRQENLETAIRQRISSNNLHETFAIDLNTTGTEQLTPDENKDLFRIVQEALNNTAKHAHASHVTICLHLEDPFWVEIEDNGKGFDPQQIFDGSHLGLRGMRERAEAIGWQLSIYSAPGSSTCIRIEKTKNGRN